MGALIDTSVLIEIERGQLSLRSLVERYGDEDVAISTVTASELLHGVHRLKGAQAARAEAFIEGLLELLPVIAFDLPEARTHARLSAELQSKGVAVGAHDLIIAATAIANDMRVATLDLRSFSRIKGLGRLRLPAPIKS
jgi:tRNA(fMet)-specific endonuclease VapC